MRIALGVMLTSVSCKRTSRTEPVRRPFGSTIPFGPSKSPDLSISFDRQYTTTRRPSSWIVRIHEREICVEKSHYGPIILTLNAYLLVFIDLKTLFFSRIPARVISKISLLPGYIRVSYGQTVYLQFTVKQLVRSALSVRRWSITRIFCYHQQ